MSTRLQFKFRHDVSEPARKKLVGEIAEHGAAHVRRMMPRQKRGPLADLYLVEIDDDALREEVRRLLDGSSLIEFVETEARRKLVR